MGYRGYQVQFRLEIAGVDCTRYIVPEQSLTVSVSRDFPNVGVFKSRGLDILVNNADHSFSPDAASNRFTQANLPASGRGARVLFQATVTPRGAGGTPETFTYAGTIQMIIEQLKKTTATLVVRDLSVQFRQAKALNFGAELTRKITDYPNANADYTATYPAFRFPKIFTPILPGTVSANIVGANDVKTALTVVDEIGVSGVLSATRVKVDYDTNHLIFEVAPTDGEDTIIEATWHTTHRSRRADGLLREMTSPQLPVGLPDFAIEAARVESESAVFGVHGKPNWQNEALTRWALPDAANKKIYFQQGGAIVEYDEEKDTYTELGSIPDDSSLSGNVGNFGDRVSAEDVTLPSGEYSTTEAPFMVTGDAIYSVRIYNNIPVNTIKSFDSSGNLVNSSLLTIDLPGSSERIQSMQMYNNQLYVCVQPLQQGSGHLREVYVLRYDLPLTSASTYTQIMKSTVGDLDTNIGVHMAITPERICLVVQLTRRVYFFDHDGNYQSSETQRFSSTYSRIRGAMNYGNYLVVLNNTVGLHSKLHVWQISPWSEQTALEVTLEIGGGNYSQIAVGDGRFYIKYSNNRNIRAFDLGQLADYSEFVGFYLLSRDFDTFYVLATNTARGDTRVDPSFSRVRLYKYVKSTKTWTNELNEQKGQPQLADVFDFITEAKYLGDNRKTLTLVRRNNKDYIFFRRVQATSAGVAYWDIAAGTITDVYKETWTGAAHKGLAYSIDFMLDERSDGIYVYTFVPSYSLSGNSLSGNASLKIYRKRVLPDASQSEIYTESFSSSGSNAYYPTSVSGVMLADDRSKIYFVLDYQREGTTMEGKAELCSIAKAGGGSRTVIKSYGCPIIGPRSPRKHDSKYFYVEGGWVRRGADSDDDPEDQHYYPNMGGNLIEILTAGTVSDYGRLLRSAFKSDSPDPTNKIYDGWGLHNSILSNLFVDSLSQLGIISGFGLPIDIDSNLPIVPLIGPVPEVENFVWITHGKILPSKIQNFNIRNQTFWEGASALALMTQFQLGFIPLDAAVTAYLTANPSADEWEAYASLFFSPPKKRTGSLRTAIPQLTQSETTINFDSGAVSVVANLQSDDAYDLSSSHANTAGLELVPLSFGGDALKVIGGAGNGDLTIDVGITAQSVKATPVLYYKDGSAPASNTDGTVIAWSAGPTFIGNAVTAQAATGEVDDADLNRYYWIVPEHAPDVTYDSGEQVASTSINILDTDAVPVPQITETGVLTTEDISGFGIVFKTERAFKSLTITFKGNPSVGVAFRIRSSTTKPTAATDAKNYGTQHAQAGGQGVEVTVTTTLSNVAANTYFFITLSGGGNRDVSGRKIRFNGTYTNDLSPVAVNITGGTVRVRFDYSAITQIAPTVQIDGVGVDDFLPGLCLIDRELFQYTGRAINGAGIQLSGVTRAAGGSERAAHAANSTVYFVNYIVRDDDDSMTDVLRKQVDLQNLRNKIVIPFRDGDKTKNHIVSDATSIARDGEWELSLANTYFSKFDIDWMELLGVLYLSRFKDIRTVVSAEIPLSLLIENDQVCVLKTSSAAIIDYLPFEVMGFVHDFRSFTTKLDLRALR